MATILRRRQAAAEEPTWKSKPLQEIVVVVYEPRWQDPFNVYQRIVLKEKIPIWRIPRSKEKILVVVVPLWLRPAQRIFIGIKTMCGFRLSCKYFNIKWLTIKPKRIVRKKKWCTPFLLSSFQCCAKMCGTATAAATLFLKHLQVFRDFFPCLSWSHFPPIQRPKT